MMTTKAYITGEGDKKEIVFSRPSEEHIEKDLNYTLRDRIFTCTTEEVQQVINEILLTK